MYNFGRGPLEVWKVSGTSHKRKCYPIHTITQKLPQELIPNIVGYHALTGCDTVSSFTGFGKKKCWKIFCGYPELLCGVGRDGSMEEVEEFVCRLYKAEDITTGVNAARARMFDKGKVALEMLPPTQDALELHLSRANYQARIWLQASELQVDVDPPSTILGWQSNPEGLSIVWNRLPCVPTKCVELVTCGCRSKCRTAGCKCFQTSQRCMSACGCGVEQAVLESRIKLMK
jgi:hypothetical protein